MKIKKCSISECLKFIEVKSNALFLSTFGVKIDDKNKRKRVSRMCENAYLSIKNPKASRALKQALDPGRRMLASLRRQLSASEAGDPPLTKSWIRTCLPCLHVTFFHYYHRYSMCFFLLSSE